MRFLKRRSKSTNDDLQYLVQQAVVKWKLIVGFLYDRANNFDFGRIWLDEEVYNIKSSEELIKRIKLFLERNKIHVPEISKDIDELILMLDVIERGKLRGNVVDWFNAVKLDMTDLVRRIKSQPFYNALIAKKIQSTEKYNIENLERAKKEIMTPAIPKSTYRFVAIPYRIGSVPIGSSSFKEKEGNVTLTTIEPSYKETNLIEVPLQAIKTNIASAQSITKKYPDLMSLKETVVVPKDNVPKEAINQVKEKDFINDGGRSIILANSLDIDLGIFGCNGLQEFRECRKGVGMVQGGISSPILPFVFHGMGYGEEKRPEGGQYLPYAIGEIRTTEQLLSHPEYHFKFCPTVHAVQIPPNFLEAGYKKYVASHPTAKNPVPELLDNSAQEICLIPSNVRLGSFHPSCANPQICYQLLQSLAPIPSQMDLIVPQIIEDFVNCFNLVARSLAQIGDLHYYFSNLNKVDNPPKTQPFIRDTPISKDIVIAQSGLYFKDLESFRLNAIENLTLLKLQIAYLFYDVGSCIELLIWLSDFRKRNIYRFENVYKVMRILERPDRVNWYDIPPNEFFLKKIMELFNKSPYLFIKKSPRGNLSLGLKTRIGEVSFETFIDARNHSEFA